MQDAEVREIAAQTLLALRKQPTDTAMAAAVDLLSELRNLRLFGTLLDLAELVSRYRPDDATVRGLYAQGLRNGAPPRQVRYFYFAGTGHETLTRVNVFEQDGGFPAEQMRVTHTEAAGDGTVPLWSALPRVLQKQVVVSEHAHVFTGMPFKLVFYGGCGEALVPHPAPASQPMTTRRPRRADFQGEQHGEKAYCVLELRE
jgi:hypothetical protein